MAIDHVGNYFRISMGNKWIMSHCCDIATKKASEFYAALIEQGFPSSKKSWAPVG